MKIFAMLKCVPICYEFKMIFRMQGMSCEVEIPCTMCLIVPKDAWNKCGIELETIENMGRQKKQTSISPFPARGKRVSVG